MSSNKRVFGDASERCRLAAVAARKIEDQRLAESMSLARSVGRIVSIMSIWPAGWALGNTVPTKTILMVFGAVGIVSVAAIALLERRLRFSLLSSN